MTKSTGKMDRLLADRQRQRGEVLKMLQTMQPASSEAIAREVGISAAVCYKMLRAHLEAGLATVVGRANLARWCIPGSQELAEYTDRVEEAAQKPDNINNRARRGGWIKGEERSNFRHRIVSVDCVRIVIPKRAVVSVFDLGKQ